MSKNKKIILASIGVLVALIAAVLLIRNPVPEAAPEPTIPPEVETSPEVPPPKEMDETHEKVIKVVDDISSELVNQAPSLWQRVVDSWNWFEAFPSKYAIILLVVGIFIVGFVANSNSSRSKKGR